MLLFLVPNIPPIYKKGGITMSMVASLLGMDMPEPIKEKMIEIHWDRSPTDPRKIRQTIILDFGKTDWDSHKAVTKAGYVVRTIRRQFGVRLSRIQQ